MIGPWFTDGDKAAVKSVLDSGDLMSGKLVELFEGELAAYLRKRHVVCVSSGTAALECGLTYWEEGRQIHPDGFIALLSAARAAGQVPECAGSGVRTHLLGVMANPQTRVIDACHTFQPGTPGDVACYSFAPNKFLACAGGCLATNDSVVAAYARHYRNHGRDGGPEVHRHGRNFRMGEMNAALGRSQLTRIDDIMGFRAQVAAWYAEELPKAAPRKSWFLYPAQMGRADHGQRSLAEFRLFDTETEMDKQTALFPIWPMMTREEVQDACRKHAPK